jgi:hypothetical protein
MGRQPSPPTAAVVVVFVQPYCPAPGISPPAHTARPARAGNPVYGAPSLPSGYASADGHPAGGANQKLSELLTKTLHLCPRCQENNAFIECLFLNKLPKKFPITPKQAPGLTPLPPTAASWPLTWWLQLPLFLPKRHKDRTTRLQGWDLGPAVVGRQCGGGGQ